MKVKKIRRAIREQLTGAGTGNLAAVSGGFPVLQEYANEAISAGRQTDADAILVAVIHADSVLIALVAGRSILLGDGIRDYLSDYHDGIEEHTRHCIDWMVDNATDGLKDENQCLVVLRDTDDDRWRGFRGDQPMTIEEIKASGRERLH
jgi:hypothetical protein